MTARVSPLAGRTLPPSALVDVPHLMTAYFSGAPDPRAAAERVAFGTSGHRGSALANAFNEAHILAVAQAICLYRRRQGIDGPLFLGRDTHALSEAAFATAIEVLAANGVETLIDDATRYTPTPAVSHAILSHNRNRTGGLADGILITPSHNPPEDGGIKYNPPSGGPADAETTGWIERAANELLEQGLRAVRRLPFSRARRAACIRAHDYVRGYVDDLINVVDLDAVRAAGVKIGIDPLGGAATPFLEPIIERYGLAATITDDTIDPTFRFMPADWDGKIRMDCSSPYAMTRLVGLREDFDVAFANDTDADRHGIVTRSGGLMRPNDYLTAALWYLSRNRPAWPRGAAIGKTVVSSGMIDRAAVALGRPVLEVPVGFKWFVGGLRDASLCFAGEESAGASFLRRDGTVWTTDKDGIILGLLAAEITASTGHDPSALYATLADRLGRPFYERIDVAATSAERKLLKDVTPDRLDLGRLAGEPVRQAITATGSRQPIGGLKVIADNGWFAARPSGTEDVYKIYAESFSSEDHLRRIQGEAQAIIARLFASTAPGDKT